MKETTRRALKQFGAINQLLKLAEESSELSAAIIKDYTEMDKDNTLAIVGEVADVYICLEYARICFGDKLVDDAIKAKLERLKRRLEK